MDCEVCGKPKDELFKGISIGKMVFVCKECAYEEKIPIIQKPDLEKLKEAYAHRSVRERMESLSGLRKETISSKITPEQPIRSRLRELPKKETRDDVVDNYDWILSLKRRRLKLSLSQAEEMSGVPRDIIFAIEHGRIPENYRDIFIKLEDAFKIRLLKIREEKINFKRGGKSEEEILEMVREKMKQQEEGAEEEKTEIEEKTEDEIFEDVSLDYLAERKKRREKQKSLIKEKQKEEDLIGDEIDLEDY